MQRTRNLSRLGAAMLLLWAGSGTGSLYPAAAQQSAQQAEATPLQVDRGSAGLWQSLKKLHTRASLMMIVAHPDDEDGGMLAYESRGLGVDTSLLTLNRGEGGQNAMSPDFWDQLGEVRTQELLAADRYYGVRQYFTRVADFGFSKTIDEAMRTWDHDRVLYDVVRAVRLQRPLVLTASFAGNVSDGHGQHQVSGEMAQEAYNAAGDPNVFPDQIAAGLRPWTPLKVYARVPFARTGEKGIYDYATGHWEPVRFRNYTNGTWIEGVPPTTVTVPEGTFDPLLGSSYLALARMGLGEQKSQNGGVGAPLAQPYNAPYHLYATRTSSVMPQHEASFFDGIDTSLTSLAEYVPVAQRRAWQQQLTALTADIDDATAAFDANAPERCAPALARGLHQTRALLQRLAAADATSFQADARYSLQHELLTKQQQFNTALGQALGLSVVASLRSGSGGGGPFGDALGVPTAQSVTPGESFRVAAHLANQGKLNVTVAALTLQAADGKAWSFAAEHEATGELRAGDAREMEWNVTAPADAAITKPYFSRPNLEQSYYDIQQPASLGEPLAPYPLAATVRFVYAGESIETVGTVQTVHRYTGPGPVLEPLLVVPPISVTIAPSAGIVPLESRTLHLDVKVHSSINASAAGSVALTLPQGWTSSPAQAAFHLQHSGDEQSVSFDVTPHDVRAQPYTITAAATYQGHQYAEGYSMTGYVPLRPYPYYQPAAYRTSGVDVAVAPGLRVGYVAGTGDDVAASLANLGVHPAFLSAEDLTSGDLARYDVIVLGIRAYAARPELRTANSRLLEFVRNGGTVVVQYQTGEFDHNYGPLPLSLSSDPERVVEEHGECSIVDRDDAILNWPNRINLDDFKNWVEERGHGFLRSWDSGYRAPLEMHDTGEDPQRGGLVYTHYGKGVYVYTAFAFFREMPEGVPGSFRLMANLLSIGRNPQLHRAQ
ncbi:MAG: PIG-L family deacetylase [Acidobacteriota bacterium]|nr:PIG-L family deacetylase [Acidobacteriota bacterium]